MNGLIAVTMKAAAIVTIVGSIICNFAGAAALVHRYSFNDGTAKDSIGSANGQLVGQVTISGGQAHFNGEKGERIELLANGPDGININTFEAVSFEAWYTADKKQAWQRVFDFGSSLGGIDSPNSGGVNCIYFSPNALYPDGAQLTEDSEAILDVGPEAHARISPEAPLKTELHVVVVADGAKITVYLGGVQVSTAPFDGALYVDRDKMMPSLDKLSNDYALLGASLWNSDPAFSGSINEFRIYKGAATAAEIAASFKAGPDHPAIGRGK